MEARFKNHADKKLAATDSDNFFAVHGVRFSVLTDRLLRVEKQANSVFCDGPTQSVVNRSFMKPEFHIERKGSEIIIKTSACTFCYSFSENRMAYIILGDSRCVSDFYKGNLKGTCRTLDGTNGRTRLENGIISKSGVAVLDDSDSLIICGDGRILPRKCREEDIYYFAYDFDYISALHDYFCLTGFPPLIPRFALGNWWSRYKAYTQEEYTALIERFKKEKIPLTVATIDMDWHWVDVVRRFGKESLNSKKPKSLLELFYNKMSPGWTGYSWNTELFPSPGVFLKYLKNEKLRVTMNLHPASGCKFYEDAYPDFAEYMGIDAASKEQIEFDICSEKFIEGYFRFLHHPHENAGVDFWWIDWQQGKKTKVKGLDPLWALNHYHTLDIGRNGKRALILSRFAGAGSHRYPLGFSGDSAQSWATLDFQPYFTATAANIGYTWWSHDIGGHHFGVRDDELYLRWVQFGIFSPIMRLHSTSNEFMGKEPWKYRGYVYSAAAEALRFRHRMLPYIYTMNRRTAVDGRALTEPMYYENPEAEGAYNCPNEYRFGSELIVCPVTRPMNESFNLAPTAVYLPKGRFTDIFSGRIYRGGAEFEMFRDEQSIPVLAKEGAIIPLSLSIDGNYCGNPDGFELLIFRGNSSFTLYEDDGESLQYKNGAFALTPYSVEEHESEFIFTIAKVQGCVDVIPEKRKYLLSFKDITSCNETEITINGERISNAKVSENGDFLQIGLEQIDCRDEVQIKLHGFEKRRNPDKKTLKTELFSRIQGHNSVKNIKYSPLLSKASPHNSHSFLSRALREFDNMWYE